MGEAKRARGALSAHALAPFFVVAALVHLGCLATRFPEVAVRMPPGFAAGLLFGTFPLLLVEGYFESRIDYGGREDMPVWMQIDSGPVKLALTLAFTYLSVVMLQTLDLAIGPVDPNPPPEWPLQQRAMWFGIMSVGMFFPNYLATTRVMVPILRALGSRAQAFPAPVAVVVVALIGSGIGYGVVFLLRSRTVVDGVVHAQSVWASFTANPGVAIGVAFAGILLPALVGLIIARVHGGREDASR